MLQKTRSLALIGLLALLALPSGGADRTSLSRSTPFPRGDGLSQLWIGNLGYDTADLQVERTRSGATESEKITLGPGETARLARTPEEEVRILNDEDLLMIAASAGFEVQTIQIEPLEWADGRADRVEGPPERLPTRTAPRKPRSAVKRGQQASAALVWTGSGLLTVGLALYEPATSVDVQLLRPDGVKLGYANVTAARPVSLKVNIGRMLEEHGYRGLLRADMKVFRGEARGSVSAPQGGTTAFVLSPVNKSGGSAYFFNANRHWATRWPPEALYYVISNGPPNTCGELNTFRNGSWLITPGWACTDGNGNVTKGPWYTDTFWADQTDDPAYIRWPDGSTTNTDWHVLDAQCPTTTRTSPGGSPPTTYYGNASDGSWGNCFGSWSHVYSLFLDTTSNLYWTPSAGSYSQGVIGSDVDGVLSGMPSCGVSWSTDFPPVGAHIPGHSYQWTTCVSDGGCAACTNLTFTR